MKVPASGSVLLLLGLLLAGLACPVRAAAPAGSETNLRDGFFLLQDVCQRESKVHWISWIKTTPPGIVDYAKEISSAADDTLATMTRLEKGDSSLVPGANPLPPIEQEVRAGIREDKQHALLFGTSGSDYVRALLIDQIEASTYIMHLAQAMGHEAPDADQAKALLGISNRWTKIRQEGAHFLRGM
jgi:hypothetical protein